jgi:cell division protein FtsL
MRRSDSGKSTVKAVLSIAFVFAVAYSAIKIIPVYVSSYELQDYIRQQNPFWLTQRAPADAIRNHILAKAKDLDLPVEPDQVKVDVGGGVSVQLDYTVPVDLKVWTLRLHFTPSADNRQL